MAQESRGDGNIPIAPIIALLIFVGGMLVQHQPLQSNRPVSQMRALTVPHYGQDVEARLWQDPLEAVQAADREQEGDTGSRVIKGSRATCGDRASDCHTPGWLKIEIEQLEREIEKLKGPEKSILVLPVMIFGGPYASDSEDRRRNRYAVLSSLIDKGYEPIYSRGIGYVRIDSAKTQSPGLPRLIPFERWDLKKYNKHVFVLWLTEESFTPGAYANLKQLFETVLPAKGVRVKVIGPASQETADELWPAGDEIQSRRHPCPNGIARVGGDCVEFLAPRLTTPPPATPSELEHSSGALRFSPDDRTLVTAILTELRNRGLKLPICGAPACDANSKKVDHIAIVVEADTNYGRSLEREFLKALGGHEDQPQNLHIFRYFRGLDGKTSHTVEESKKSSEPAELGSSKEIMAPQERAQGDSQFDYLLRIASRVRDQNDHLECNTRGYRPFSLDPTGRSIRAVVVLGSDIYDKLAILHALRERLPKAVFATTDMDAGYLENDQLRWTRNLIVASGYDLRFHRTTGGGSAHKGPPPFRDTYQTATFVATSQALLDADSSDKSFESARAEALNTPRLVEIGDGSAVKLKPMAAGAGAREQAGVCESPDKQNSCSNAVHVVAGLVSVLLFGLALSWCLRSVVREYWGWLLAGTVLTAAYAFSVVWISGRDGEEPLRWLDGVSIWPSEFVRLAVVVLGVAFLVYERGHLKSGEARIAAEFSLLMKPPPNELMAFWDDLRTGDAWKALWVRIFPSGSENPGGGSEVNVVCLWDDYQKWTSRTAFVSRLVLGAVLYALFALVAVSQDPPITPGRGPLSLALDHVTVLASYFVTWLVLFATVGRVAVTTLFLRRLFGNGAEAKLSNWDAETLRRFCGASSKAFSTYVDLMLSARLTELVSDIVLYPFILSVLLLVAYSRLFDNWVTPWGLMAVVAFGLAMVSIGALALRSSAERIRRYTIERLTNAQLGARDRVLGAPARRLVRRNIMKDGMASEPGQNKPCDPDKLKLMREVATNLRQGAFAPLSEQPIVRALILPFGGAGALSILEYLLMAKG
ncbi:hypothetical protein [Ralstonia pseudosolanacearum]|uniref:hypothetical protein n=1 Tax=Ralstonia pseudosolanacearum TaxID=1310165 RepID=UPI001FF75B3F|nr:hypothetical protein [Ralstonia pseudosolanacearum]